MSFSGEDIVEDDGDGGLKFCLGGRGEKAQAVLKLCSDRWLRNSFKQSLSNFCSMRKRAAQNALFNMIAYDAILSRSIEASESALLRKRGHFGRAQDTLPRKIGNDEEYDMSWRETCEDIEWLKASGMGENRDEYEWRDRQQ